MRTRCLLAGFSALVLLAPAAIAQTPDADPPSTESICDPLNDRTAGLFGLCHAYCEAQDCAGEVGDPWHCSVLLHNYNQLRQPGDPNMPCLTAPCPCFDAAFIATELLVVRTCRPTRAVGIDANVCSATIAINPDVPSCSRTNQNVNQFGGCQLVSLVNQPVTPAEFLGCEDLIRSICP